MLRIGLNKPKTPGNCRFLLSNLHKGPILHFVPDENIGNDSGELCIRLCNFQLATAESPNTKSSINKCGDSVAAIQGGNEGTK